MVRKTVLTRNGFVFSSTFVPYIDINKVMNRLRLFEAKENQRYINHFHNKPPLVGILLIGSVLVWLSIFALVGMVKAQTPTPAPLKLDLSKVATSDLITTIDTSFSNPRDYTIVGSELTFRCYHEPIVKKERDGKWTITFKPK